jgi:crotonobetainyl-CoA:carnitine CoA-transferase CaiB-like acyl-CoA transferase
MNEDGSVAKVLSGIRVIDLTRHMAGPYATATLADNGADVIKVETLPNGDPSRSGGVHYYGDQSALFVMWNRGKRSIALNLRRPEGLEVVHRLVQEADVLVENYRPGVAERMGIGYEALSAINPRLVHCSISAFGSSGPLSSYPGTDPVVQAVSGVMSVTGEAEGGPSLVGVPVADFIGSVLGVQGILLALLARERTGRGQRVDVSMLYGMLSMFTTRLASYWATGVNPERHGSAHSVLVPYQVFATADGQVMAGTYGSGSWPKLCAALGLPELVDDPDYATNVKRHEHRDKLIALVQSVMQTRTTAEWEERFRSAGALFAPVNSFSDILEHEHVRAAGLVRELVHPVSGPTTQLGPPVRLSEHPADLGLPPPLLGEHTREILGEAGYSDEQANQLIAAGVAKAWEGER